MPTSCETILSHLSKWHVLCHIRMPVASPLLRGHELWWVLYSWIHVAVRGDN